MVKFEKVSRFADIDLPLPTRSTSLSAGYDFAVAEDIVLPPYGFFETKMRDSAYEFKKLMEKDYWAFVNPFSWQETEDFVKKVSAKVPLVSTGMKCYLEPDQYLQLQVRSSTPLKHWIMCANSVGR